MKEGKMKKYLGIAVMVVGMQSHSVAADKLSFPHAAELTDQAKTILWQELKTAEAPNSSHQQIVCLSLIHILTLPTKDSV